MNVKVSFRIYKILPFLFPRSVINILQYTEFRIYLIIPNSTCFSPYFFLVFGTSRCLISPQNREYEEVRFKTHLVTKFPSDFASEICSTLCEEYRLIY